MPRHVVVLGAGVSGEAFIARIMSGVTTLGADRP